MFVNLFKEWTQSCIFGVDDVAMLDDLRSQGPFFNVTWHSQQGLRADHGALFILQPLRRQKMACADIRFLLRATWTVGCRPSVFLVTLCELPDCVTQYVQSTLELFLSQCYLLLSFNKAFPTASGRGWPALCASAPGLVLLWKTMTEASGEAQESPQEGQAAPALALEAEMPSPILRGTRLGGPGHRGLKQSGNVGSCQQSAGPDPTDKAPPERQSLGPQSLCSVKECFH